MMMKYTLLAILTLFASKIHAELLTKVVVIDSEFNVFSEITDSQELSKFKELWDSRDEVILRTQPVWTHTIDVTPGERWLYSNRGYAQVLSKQALGMYKIDRVAQFNEQLKIYKKALQVDR
ncbi:MAG: hypothetical protein KBT53_08060 [Porticoccus sp.]|nr:hypothetical protein [Porticoccus sp.]MBQ0808336.1 hypothetical protein [Porticoccus sp.]